MENALTQPTDYSSCDKTIKCPWVSCRYHLAVDLKIRKNGSPLYNEQEVDEIEHTCALTVANEGPHKNDEVAVFMGMHKEVARRQFNRALDKFRRAYLQSTFDALATQ